MIGNRKNPIAFYGRFIIILVVCYTMLGLSLIQNGSAETIYNLNNQIKQLEQQRKQKLNKQKTIDHQMNSLEREKQQARTDIKGLDQKIGQTKTQLTQKEAEISKTEKKIKQLEEEIIEAQHQIEAREELLKNRVREIYESGGSVSYLEVLLGASSFSDFLVRMDFIKLLVDQDQKILDDYIAAKEVIEQNKIEVDKLMVLLQEQVKNLQVLQASLQDQRKQKSLRIASIEQQQGELTELDEQMQQEVLNLVNQVAAKRSQLQEKQRAQAQNQSKTVASSSKGGKFAWPVPASSRITSTFGTRFHPITGNKKAHNGLDIGASTPGVSGDTVVAAESGTVIISEYLRGYGNTVVIDHGNGLRTLYAHLQSSKVNVGQAVSRGQKIAVMGSTGSSTSAHLHFEVHKNGSQVNPISYIR